MGDRCRHPEGVQPGSSQPVKNFAKSWVSVKNARIEASKTPPPMPKKVPQPESVRLQQILSVFSQVFPNGHVDSRFIRGGFNPQRFIFEDNEFLFRETATYDTEIFWISRFFPNLYENPIDLHGVGEAERCVIHTLSDVMGWASYIRMRLEDAAWKSALHNLDPNTMNLTAEFGCSLRILLALEHMEDFLKEFDPGIEEKVPGAWAFATWEWQVDIHLEGKYIGNLNAISTKDFNTLDYALSLAGATSAAYDSIDLMPNTYEGALNSFKAIYIYTILRGIDPELQKQFKMG